MADTSLYVSGGAALIAIGQLAERLLRPRLEASHRETLLPPAPADLEALRARVDADAQRAQEFRERVIDELAGLRTLLSERTRRGAPQRSRP